MGVGVEARAMQTARLWMTCLVSYWRGEKGGEFVVLSVACVGGLAWGCGGGSGG